MITDYYSYADEAEDFMDRALDRAGLPPGTREAFCPACGNRKAELVFRDDSFDYAGTHCTGGRGGTHYGSRHNDLVTKCCEADPLPSDWEEEVDA